jgi:hypothetical protein
MSELPDGPVQSDSAASALRHIVTLLESLSKDDRTRVMASVAAFFQLPSTLARFSGPTDTGSPTSSVHSLPKFSQDRAVSPKQFMLEKAPSSDIDRVACLAFYLAHYRDTAEFLTGDISTLNTEAAQVRLSNPSYSVKNAIRAGLVTMSANGKRQLTAAGEQYVMALPDRDQARDVLQRYARRRRVLKRSREDQMENGTN